MLLIGEDWSGGAEGRDAGQHHARARGEVRRHPRIRCQGQRECYRARAGCWSVTLLSTSRALGVLCAPAPCSSTRRTTPSSSHLMSRSERVLSRARGVLVSYLVINFSRAWCFMSASTMLEHEEKYAVILACDVKIRQAV